MTISGNTAPARSRGARAVVSVLAAGMALGLQPTQKPRIDPAVLLWTYGSVENVDDIPILVLRQGPGEIGEHVYTRSGATGLRFLLRIDERPATGTLEIRIVDGRGAISWAYAPAERDRTIWSETVHGSSATIRLVTSSKTAAVRVVIDKVAVSTPVPQPKSIFEPDERSPILAQPEAVRQSGRAVAKIRYVGRDNKEHSCTGFLVAPDLLLTNEHCVRTDSEAESARVDFDYDFDAAVAYTTGVVKVRAFSESLDYSLLELTERMDRTPLRVIDPPPAGQILPVDGQLLRIIQHPGGEPKQVSEGTVSERNCLVKGVGLLGVDKTTDFGHECDTMKGSSGSPVQLVADGTVVGLHHWAAEGIPTNQAVSIVLILKDIATQDDQAAKQILRR